MCVCQCMHWIYEQKREREKQKLLANNILMHNMCPEIILYINLSLSLTLSFVPVLDDKMILWWFLDITSASTSSSSSSLSTYLTDTREFSLFSLFSFEKFCDDLSESSTSVAFKRNIICTEYDVIITKLLTICYRLYT